MQRKINESTAGADVSMEVSKLHNIKLIKLLAISNIYYSFYTYDEHFCIACQNQISQKVGKDRQ